MTTLHPHTPTPTPFSSHPSPSRTGYQGEVSLFLAPPTFALKDCTTWSETGASDASQVAYVRPKIHDSIDYTWANMQAGASATTNATGVQAGSAPRMQQVMRPLLRDLEGGRATGMHAVFVAQMVAHNPPS